MPEIIHLFVTVYSVLREALIILAILGACFGAWSFYQLYHWKKKGKYAAELGDISAYIGRPSYTMGEIVPLHVHTTRDATARIYRLGRELEDTGIQIPVPRTLQSNRYSTLEGVDWHPTAEANSDALRPGMYAIALRQNGNEAAAFWVLLIVKPREPKPVAVIASTNTFDAYNEFGGISRYENRRLNRVTRALGRMLMMVFEIELPPVDLPMTRPNTAISEELARWQSPLKPAFSKLIKNEWSLIAFLEREGIDYAVYGDEDFAFSEMPRESNVIIFHGHAEYWSDEMFFNLESYLRSGGRLIVSAGNPLFRPVEYAGPHRKYRIRDYDRYFVSRLIGTFLTFYWKKPPTPYRVQMADHWVFNGTGLENGDLLGKQSTALHRPYRGDGEPGLTGGASGMYTQKISTGGGAFSVLAKGLDEIEGAHMVYRDTEHGGWVFNTSSGAFTGSLLVDGQSATLFRNLIEEAVARQRKPPAAKSPKAAETVTAAEG